METAIKHEFWHRMEDGKFAHFVATITDGVTSYYIDGKLTSSVKETFEKNDYSTSETSNSQEIIS